MKYIKTLPAFWLTRLYLASSVLIFSCIGTFDTASIVHRSILGSGPEGFWCLVALGGLSFFSLLDVVINDLMPPCFYLRFIERNRHLVYMGLSVGITSTAYVIAVHSGLVSIHARLALESFIAAALAFLDLFYRHRK